MAYRWRRREEGGFTADAPLRDPSAPSPLADDSLDSDRLLADADHLLAAVRERTASAQYTVPASEFQPHPIPQSLFGHLTAPTYQLPESGASAFGPPRPSPFAHLAHDAVSANLLAAAAQSTHVPRDPVRDVMDNLMVAADAVLARAATKQAAFDPGRDMQLRREHLLHQQRQRAAAAEAARAKKKEDAERLARERDQARFLEQQRLMEKMLEEQHRTAVEARIRKERELEEKLRHEAAARARQQAAEEAVRLRRAEEQLRAEATKGSVLGPAPHPVAQAVLNSIAPGVGGPDSVPDWQAARRKRLMQLMARVELRRLRHFFACWHAYARRYSRLLGRFEAVQAVRLTARVWGKWKHAYRVRAAEHEQRRMRSQMLAQERLERRADYFNASRLLARTFIAWQSWARNERYTKAIEAQEALKKKKMALVLAAAEASVQAKRDAVRAKTNVEPMPAKPDTEAAGPAKQKTTAASARTDRLTIMKRVQAGTLHPEAALKALRAMEESRLQEEREKQVALLEAIASLPVEDSGKQEDDKGIKGKAAKDRPAAEKAKTRGNTGPQQQQQQPQPEPGPPTAAAQPAQTSKPPIVGYSRPAAGPAGIPPFPPPAGAPVYVYVPVTAPMAAAGGTLYPAAQALAALAHSAGGLAPLVPGAPRPPVAPLLGAPQPPAAPLLGAPPHAVPPHAAAAGASDDSSATIPAAGTPNGPDGPDGCQVAGTDGHHVSAEVTAPPAPANQFELLQWAGGGLAELGNPAPVEGDPAAAVTAEPAETKAVQKSALLRGMAEREERRLAMRQAREQRERERMEAAKAREDELQRKAAEAVEAEKKARAAVRRMELEQRAALDREREKLVQEARVNNEKASAFHRRKLLTGYGMAPWRALVVRRKHAEDMAGAHASAVLAGRCFRAWHDDAAAAAGQRRLRAQLFWRDRRLRAVLAAWKLLVENARSDAIFADRHLDWRRVRSCLDEWIVFTKEENRRMNKIRDRADAMHRRNLLRAVLRAWMRLGSVLEMDRLREARLAALRAKVTELLPNYQPPPADD
eukprot:m.85979 g.85979  ORF g.85979 m.85979 type:complete len:1040 (+) comp8262_c0_seq1:15-3134(+)